MPLRINLDDRHLHLSLAPHTLFKPSPFLRIGIFNNLERYWHFEPDLEIGFLTTDYLSASHLPLENAITIDAGIIPTFDFIQQIKRLSEGESLTFQQRIVARFGTQINLEMNYDDELCHLKNRWDLPKLNAEILIADFNSLTRDRISAVLPENCRLIGPKEGLFLEEGAIANDVTFNTNSGPVYVASNAEIMEGSLIRGPFSLGERSQVKMGAKIYGATTVGPDCKVGGEINNVIFESFSNKSHDGFLGNGYISSWCNIGADTNASNLMNNYGTVEVHDYATGQTVSSGEQFVGLHMGDHAKCGINTMFNTGTAVGVACNIYGPGFFKKHIPSFSFGEPSRLFPYRFEKAIEGIESMMARRNRSLSENERAILQHLCDERDLF
jgi:UDP-N-acetylglucosamine diphosphorylase/glucosamine-1-phosphate N-acetyltransferase